jgi:hypothetical protein
MSRLSPGIFALVLTFAAGVWTAVSPFAMQTQPSGIAWTSSTVNDVVVGGILIVASLLGIGMHYLLGLRAHVQATIARLEAEVAEEEQRRREEAA